ncbi:ribonuclease H-like protein [Phanerochaete sordida]|uniref:Ribonuclease H-like protein n=1 Tax=Phanerochaete sordida TaxID=48140 RepID=A0A9P3GFZ2_9APHY|nr:ribonuclease H-like protein [Phanerochaete sordida]
MKRAQEFPVPASPSSLPPASKKLKVSPRESSGISVQDPGSSEDGWTKVEKRKAKKTKRTEGKLDANPPKFMYNRAELLKRREAVGISDIRDLVLHLAADAPPTSWVRVENPRSVQKVVALLIPGLTPDMLSLPPLPTSATANPHLPLEIPLPKEDGPSTGVPFIAKTFSHACPTHAPGDQTRMHSVLSAFFQAPVSGEEKKRRILERVASERSQEKSPLRYLLTTEQMLENDYPVPSYIAETFQKSEGWVETPQPSEESLANKSPRIFAIDCEMCQTEDGKELARVCLIDYASGVVLYDKLVMPKKPITDYLTRWSGITEEALRDVTTTFEEVQGHLLALLSVSPTPVLLGHSLESDLKALKICHPRCIDTAVIYHHPRGRPLKPGLAWLTKKWCGREIQNRGEGGHDPEEDARACLDLLRKKIDNGPGFGEFKVDFESIFERMSRARNGTVSSIVVDHGNPANWHGSKATTTIACKTDDEVLQGLLGAVPSHTFSFGRFTALADARGWITNRANPDTTIDAVPAAPAPAADLTGILATLDAQLKALYDALPARTAVVIFTGHADPRRMAELNARKSAFETAIRAGRAAEELGELRWTSADGRELEEEVAKAKRGLLFVGVKDPR